jgi:hypothetical protein
MLVIIIAGLLLHRSPPSSLAFVVSTFPILPSSSAIAVTTTARTMSQNIILPTWSSTWSVDRRHQRGTKRTTTSMTGTTTKSKTMQLYGLPQRNHGESKEEYFRRMTQAAADPEQFARLVLTKEVVDVVPNNNNSHHPAGSSSSSSSSSDTSDDSTTSGRRGYVRAEEWEAEQQKQMSTEERRLQFEAQMHGDRFRQNEILQRHLNSF